MESRKEMCVCVRMFVCSAAICHEHHEIFTNEDDKHIRGGLILIADTQ